MANLVAVAYDDVGQAQQVMNTLGQLQKEHAIELEDAVIVEHQPGGKMKLHQPSRPPPAPQAGPSGAGSSG